MVNYFENYYNEYYDNFLKEKELNKVDRNDKIKSFQWKDSIEYKCLYNLGYKNGIVEAIYCEGDKLKAFIQSKEENLKVKRDIISHLINSEDDICITEYEKIESELMDICNKITLEKNLSNKESIFHANEMLIKVAISDGRNAAKMDVDKILKELYLSLNILYNNILFNMDKSIVDFKYNLEVAEKNLNEYKKIKEQIEKSIIKVENLKKLDLSSIKKTMLSLIDLLS